MVPPARRPTSSDVAARAGVSRATVSMVLNNRVEGTVAPATRDRVLRAAEELGYARSAIALSLKQQRTRTIGLITDEIATSPWAGRMVRAASMAASRADYMVITVDLSLRDASVEGAMRTLAERQVDGLLYATMGRRMVPAPAARPGLPMVLLNCETADGALGEGTTAAGSSSADPQPVEPPAFVPDDYGGARRAARRLAEVGHERIVMLSGGDDSVACLEREAGFRDELEERGLEPEVLDAGWQMDDGYRSLSRLLGDGAPPTAVFCIRDRVAAGVLHAASAAGLQVPRDLSVIGFDDEDYFAETLTPPLTTIGLPHVEMGEQAMARLLALIDAPEAPRTAGRPAPVRIACPLVERATVGRPRD